MNKQSNDIGFALSKLNQSLAIITLSDDSRTSRKQHSPSSSSSFRRQVGGARQKESELSRWQLPATPRARCLIERRVN